MSAESVVNLYVALDAEIGRVADLRELYLEMPLGAGVAAAHLMWQSLERARAAVSIGDVVEQLAALKDLRGYTE